MAEFPSVPSSGGLAVAGTELEYQLVRRDSPGCWALGCGIVAAIWFTVLFAAILPQFAGRMGFDWLFLIPLVLISLVMAAGVLFTVSQWIIDLRVPKCLLELAQFPVHLGSPVRALFIVTGDVKLERLTLELYCSEDAKYQQGTNTRTETATTLYQQVLNEMGDDEFRSGNYQKPFLMELPADGMHSFQSTHHAIRWHLMAMIDLKGWPPTKREYTLIVHPPTEPPTIIADGLAGD
jgi:hypothetical protein